MVNTVKMNVNVYLETRKHVIQLMALADANRVLPAMTVQPVCD